MRSINITFLYWTARTQLAVREIARINVVPHGNKTSTVPHKLLLFVASRIDVSFAIQPAPSLDAFVDVRRKWTPPIHTQNTRIRPRAQKKILRTKKEKGAHRRHGISKHVLHCSRHSTLGINWHLSRHLDSTFLGVVVVRNNNTVDAKRSIKRTLFCTPRRHFISNSILFLCRLLTKR